MKALVGVTGFVGSNLSLQTDFDFSYHSSDIRLAFGTRPDLLVYAGIRAEKYLANQFPQEDLRHISEAMENIQKISPKKLVLISTIDVYPKPVNVDEECMIEGGMQQPYGKNRYLLEQWVENHIRDYLIIRLPGLFGRRIKKNFLYDFIHRIPALLKPDQFEELCSRKPELALYYHISHDGFYRCNDLTAESDKKLRQLLEELEFSALNFTDSRAVFQFYDIARLWNDIELMLSLGIKKVNLAPEPVIINDLYCFLTGKSFVNELDGKIPCYDMRSRYAQLFGGEDGYMMKKDEVLRRIKQFVENEISSF